MPAWEEPEKPTELTGNGRARLALAPSGDIGREPHSAAQPEVAIVANGEHPLESAKLTACLLQIPVIAVDRWFGLESVDVIGEVVYNAVAGEQECCAVPGASTVELSVDELLRRARPLPPHEEMVIDDLTEAEAAAFFAAVNS